MQPESRGYIGTLGEGCKRGLRGKRAAQADMFTQAEVCASDKVLNDVGRRETVFSSLKTRTNPDIWRVPISGFTEGFQEETQGSG